MLGIESDYTRTVLRTLFLLAAVVSAASAQYEVARKPADYPSHAAWPKFDVGAEYLVHSIPVEKGAIFARDYLVIEVAIYPRNHQTVKIVAANFTLHINDNKSVLMPESPGFVASSIEYPSWQEHPRTEAQVGPVILGRPADAPHFPGDPNAAGRLPPPEHDPDKDTPREAPKNVTEMVTEAALPEIETRVPVKGALYFFYDRKLKTIKTLDLVYEDHGAKSYLSIK